MALRYSVTIILAISLIVSVYCEADTSLPTSKNASSVTNNNAGLKFKANVGTSHVNYGGGMSNFGSFSMLRRINGGNRVLGYNYKQQQQQQQQRQPQQEQQQQRYHIKISGLTAEPSKLVFYELSPYGQNKQVNRIVMPIVSNGNVQTITTPNQPFTTTFMVNARPQQSGYSAVFNPLYNRLEQGIQMAIPNGNVYLNRNAQSNDQGSNGFVSGMSVSSGQESQKAENGRIASHHVLVSTPNGNPRSSKNAQIISKVSNGVFMGKSVPNGPSQKVANPGSSEKDIPIPIPSGTPQTNQNTQGTSKGSNGVSTNRPVPNGQYQGVRCYYLAAGPIVITPENFQLMTEAQIKAHITNKNCVFVPLGLGSNASSVPAPVSKLTEILRGYPVLAATVKPKAIFGAGSNASPTSASS